MWLNAQTERALMYPLHGVCDAGPLVSTFSIVGYDPEVPAWGIAIASRFLAVGAQTCWGAYDAGIVVVQANLNAQNGVEALELLRQKVRPQEVIDQLMVKDFNRDRRQIAIIDQEGEVATYTGARCNNWSGGIIGTHCAAQGNTLLSGKGCEAMVDHFVAEKGSLARRLVNALSIGDAVAGDARGRQASALLVIRPPWEEPLNVFSEPTIDLRVDDHENPFRELSRLLDLHELLYLPTAAEERMALDKPAVWRLQQVMAHLGHYHGELTGFMDAPTRESLLKTARLHNLRNRLSDTEWLDRRALEYLESRARLR